MKGLSLLIVLATVLTPVLAEEPAPSGGKVALSSEPVILEPGDETAVLYLVSDETWFQRGFSGKKEIYLDDEPLGYLEGETYLVAEVEPGLRGLLTSSKQRGKQWHWIDLSPGRTYTLFLQSHFVQMSSSGSVVATGTFVPGEGPNRGPNVVNYFRWWLSWPRDVGEMIESLELKRIVTTEAGMAALRAKGWDKYYEKQISKKKIARDRDEARVKLPLIEQAKLRCRMVEEDQSFRSGKLKIDFVELVWESKNKRIAIPIDQIWRVESRQFDILVEYGPEDERQTLVLYAEENPRHQRILLHLLEAMPRAPAFRRACSTTASNTRADTP